MRNEILILLFQLALCHGSFAQVGLSDEADIVSSILAVSDENDIVTIMENLSDLTENPVKINSGDEEEISRLFFLSEFQVRVLADHVGKHGMIVSLFEIATLPGFDRSTAMMMSSYITLEAVEHNNLKKRGITGISTTAIFRMPVDENREPGVRSLLRLKHESSSISYGLTAENDAGESFTFKNYPGFDFISGYMMYKGSGVVNRIIAGDYSLRFGEGIAFNNNAWQGSRVLLPSFMTGRCVVSPYTSTDENNFFRGFACIIGKMTGGAVLFLSSNSIDARVEYDQAGGALQVSNLVKGGLHDTPSGLSARNSLRENIAGIHLSGGTRSLRGGITASYTNFSLPFSPDTLNGDAITDLKGDRLVNLALDLKAGTGKLLFFSEGGWSFPGSWAALGGIRMSPVNRITANMLIRHFSDDYYSFHSKAFGTGSSVSNETGIAGGLHIEVARHLFLSAGADLFYYPWLRYRSSGPSTGSRLELRCEYTPDENLSVRLSFSSSDREYDIQDTGVPSSAREKKYLVNVRFAYSPADFLHMTSRGSYSMISRSSDRGYLLGQDIMLSFNHLPVKVWMTYTLFSTGSFDTRLYYWENDLLQCFNIPALYGEGSRSFIMLSWKPWPQVELRAKYGETATDGAEAREVRMQCKVRF